MKPLKEKDKEDPLIKNIWKLYRFEEPTMNHVADVNGVYIIYDDMLNILHIGLAKEGQVEQIMKKHLKDNDFPKAEFRQVFETEDDKKAEELLEDWKKKYLEGNEQG
ncbi:MAG: hypothetical protein ABIH68_03650 [bacterium]